MRIVNIGRGLYEVYDGPMGRDGVPYAVHVLGEGSCTCALFTDRLAKWKADPDPTKSARVWCIHLEAAARHHNDSVVTTRRRAKFPLAKDDYAEEAFNNARDDLRRMLDDMEDE